MKIKGSKKAIARVFRCLKAHYNYGEGKPSHQHFFRIATAEKVGEPVLNSDGTYTQYLYGDCAWSVSSCMLDGAFSYYSTLKKDYPDTFMGTTLLEQSKDCTIEVFSEEPGMCFSEHYIFKNGKCVCESSCDVNSAGYDKKGKVTEDIDWETYEGETILLNQHRFGQTGDYLWTY